MGKRKATNGELIDLEKKPWTIPTLPTKEYSSPPFTQPTLKTIDVPKFKTIKPTLGEKLGRAGEKGLDFLSRAVGKEPDTPYPEGTPAAVQSAFNIARGIGSGVSTAFNVGLQILPDLIPDNLNQDEKQRYQLGYNPFAQGTGSQSVMEDGGFIAQSGRRIRYERLSSPGMKDSYSPVFEGFSPQEIKQYWKNIPEQIGGVPVIRGQAWEDLNPQRHGQLPTRIAPEQTYNPNMRVVRADDPQAIRTPVREFPTGIAPYTPTEVGVHEIGETMPSMSTIGGTTQYPVQFGDYTPHTATMPRIPPRQQPMPPVSAPRPAPPPPPRTMREARRTARVVAPPPPSPYEMASKIPETRGTRTGELSPTRSYIDYLRDKPVSFGRESFSPQQRETIYRTLEAAHRRTGKDVSGTEYEDYRTAVEPETYEDIQKLKKAKVTPASVFGSGPGYDVAATLGRFSYVRDPKSGAYVVTDNYDFANRFSRQGDIDVSQRSLAELPYAVGRNIASQKERREGQKKNPIRFKVYPSDTMSRYYSRREQGGGLKRSEDYGSKKKPYPSVDKEDFAGGGRSYPIPTKADAVDALRLAGLHGRSDVKAKVYKKYPELKKDQYGDYLEPYEPYNYDDFYDDLYDDYSYDEYDYDMPEGRSGIYIKPKNRGKFTATKKRTGKTTEELTHSKNPLTRKRAIFAQNARKWKKGQEGLGIPAIDPTGQYAEQQMYAGLPVIDPLGQYTGVSSVPEGPMVETPRVPMNVATMEPDRNDYSGQSFKSAFNKARKDLGAKGTFMWNGKLYNTKLASDNKNPETGAPISRVKQQAPAAAQKPAAPKTPFAPTRPVAPQAYNPFSPFGPGRPAAPARTMAAATTPPPVAPTRYGPGSNPLVNPRAATAEVDPISRAFGEFMNIFNIEQRAQRYAKMPSRQEGGPIGNVGDELDLTPQQIAYYESLGYAFE